MHSQSKGPRYVTRNGFSYSALDAKIRCFRRWAFQSWHVVEREELSANLFGIMAHSMGEEYLKYGTTPNQLEKPGKILATGLHLLPKPGTVEVEGSFAIAIGDLIFDGKIDFRSYDWRYVSDLKFISDTTKYAYSEAEMREQIQPNLYALAACVRGRFDVCQLEWLWFPKHRGSLKTTRVRISIKQAYEYVVEKLVPHARDMRAARKHLNLVRLDLLQDEINRVIPCDIRHCHDFGGLCPAVNVCDFGGLIKNGSSTVSRP